MEESKKKALLFRELCRLLAFDTYVLWGGDTHLLFGYGTGRVSLLKNPLMSNPSGAPMIEEVKPLLYPISSMTDEQYKDLRHFLDLTREWKTDLGKVDLIKKLSSDFPDAYGIFIHNELVTEWLDMNHFDRFNLCGWGLAVDPTTLGDEDPYKRYSHSLYKGWQKYQ